MPGMHNTTSDDINYQMIYNKTKEGQAWDKTQGVSHHPQPQNFAILKGKIVVKCTSARKFTEQRNIKGTTITKKIRHAKQTHWETSDTPKNLAKLCPRGHG